MAEWNTWWKEGQVPQPLAGRPRAVLEELSGLLEVPELKILTGVRRSGKSTLLYQLAARYLERGLAQPSEVLLVNFEDSLLARQPLDAVLSAYRVATGIGAPKLLLLDEVHLAGEWAPWLRKQYDLKKLPACYLTGSARSLLPAEYAGLLTGRNIPLQILPLSFQEALVFTGAPLPEPLMATTEERDGVLGHLDRYIVHGGFPEVLLREQSVRRRLLGQYFEDIVLRDVVGRHQVPAQRIRDLALFLMANVGNTVSLQSLRRTFGSGIQTVADDLARLEEAFLIFSVSLYDPSLRRQQANPKKIYSVDPGLRNAVAFATSPDRGRLVENIVFLELLRRGMEVFYWRSPGRREVDFLVRRGTGIMAAIQVCSSVGEKKTLRRELAALAEAAEAFPGAELLLINEERSGVEEQNGKPVRLVRLWEWLLAGEGRR